MVSQIYCYYYYLLIKPVKTHGGFKILRANSEQLIWGPMNIAKDMIYFGFECIVSKQKNIYKKYHQINKYL